MQLVALVASLAIASAVSAVSPIPLSTDIDILCPDMKVLDTSFVGENKDVKMQTIVCDLPVLRARELETRQSSNVCGAQCNTNCFSPSGGGPDPNECHVISDALLFASQNTGPLFNITPTSPGVPGVTMQYKSCKTFFLNQASSNLTYCRSDWAAVNDFVATNCQSTQNAHGGNCVAADQRWFIQVQHS